MILPQTPPASVALTIAPLVPAALAGCCALGLIVLVWVLRRRLPVAQQAGIVVAAIGCPLLMVVPWLPGDVHLDVRAPLFILISLLFVPGVFLANFRAEAARTEQLRRRYTTLRVWGRVCLLVAFVATCALSAVDWLGYRGDSAEAHHLQYGVFPALVTAGFAAIWQRTCLSSYPLLAVVITILACWLRPAISTPATSFTVIALCCLAVAVLILALAPTFSAWRRRRRVWLTEPHRLLEPPPRLTAYYAVLTVACGLFGFWCVLVPPHPITPVAVLIGAYACLTIGHVRGWDLVSELGLLLIGEAVVLAIFCWFLPGTIGVLLGITLAGGLMLWFARFWHQQLENGEAWTTTGRMIPSAERLAYVAAGGVFVVASMFAFSADRDSAALRTEWSVWLALALTLVFCLRLIVNARRAGEIARYAALVALLAPTLTVWSLFGDASPRVAPLLAYLTVGALLLLLREGRSASEQPEALMAVVTGVLPVALLFTAIQEALSIALITASVVCIVANILLQGRATTTAIAGHPQT